MPCTCSTCSGGCAGLLRLQDGSPICSDCHEANVERINRRQQWGLLLVSLLVALTIVIIGALLS